MDVGGMIVLAIVGALVLGLVAVALRPRESERVQDLEAQLQHTMRELSAVLSARREAEESTAAAHGAQLAAVRDALVALSIKAEELGVADDLEPLVQRAMQTSTPRRRDRPRAGTSNGAAEGPR